jgi:glycosyltransferase involved in cell wall biosynthesis
MENQIKIACLPVAGIENPYQFLMIEGLQSEEYITAKNGVHDKFFGIIRTAIVDKPDYIHFDWETSYYYRKSFWMTILSIPVFMLQILIVKYVLKCKLVWTSHNIVPHDAKHIKTHRFCRRFFASQMHWIRLFSDKSIEKASKEFKVNKNKFVVCPEGSYVDYYSNFASKNESRNKLGIKEDEFVFLYLGMIKPYKGIEKLIKAFKELNLNNSKLIIAGKVLHQKYFETIFTNQSNIEFHNKFIQEKEIQYYYNASNVVVLPFNKIENSGSIILAMGFNKVVIAPKIGILEERLSQQKEFLFKTENDLTDYLKKSYKKRETLDLIGQLNKKELEKHNWSDFAKFFKL